MGPLGSVIPWWAKGRSHRLEHHLLAGMGALPTGAPALQCSSHAAKREGEDHLKVPRAQPIETAKVMALAHPSVMTLLESTDWEVLDIVEQVYHREYVLALNELPCQQQEEYMMKLQQELNWHMARVGLMEGPVPARPTSQGHRGFCSCSSSQTQSPSARPLGAKVAKHLMEDSSMRQSQSRGWCSWSKCRSNTHRSELQWLQSPSPFVSCIETSPSRPVRHSSPITKASALPSHRWVTKQLPEWPSSLPSAVGI